MDWVLVPYVHRNLTWPQHAYNERVEGARGMAKEAFMRLKAKWGCLRKRTEMKLRVAQYMRDEGGGAGPKMRFDIFDDEVVPENGVRSVNAVHVRDNCAQPAAWCIVTH